MKRAMRLWLTAVLTTLLPLLAAATPATLSIEPFTMSPGETKQMLIDLTNPDDQLTLVQFDLYLPAGLTIAEENGELAIDIAGRTTWKKHSLSAHQASGYTRFLLSSSTNAVISGTSGAIISISLTAANTFSGGTILLTNQLLVTPSAKETKPANYTYTVQLTPMEDVHADISFPALTLNCDNLSTSITWSSFISQLKAVAGTNFAIDNYDVEGGGSLDHLSLLSSDYATVVTTGIGASTLGRVANNLQWSFTQQTVMALFYDANLNPLAPQAYNAYFKLTPKVSGALPTITVKATIPSVNYPGGTFSADSRLAQMWYQQYSSILATTPDSRYEIHANTEIPGQTGADDELFIDISTAFANNQFTITPATGFTFDADADVFFDISKYAVKGTTSFSSDMIYTGASGQRYVLWLNDAYDLTLKASPLTGSSTVNYNNYQSVVTLSGEHNKLATFQTYVAPVGSEYAHDLLNHARANQLAAGETFTTHAILHQTDYCLPIAETGPNQFDIRWLRPLSAVMKDDLTVVDDPVEGTRVYLADLVSFIDWRDVAFGPSNRTLMNYYGITTVTANIDQAMTDLNGSWQRLADATNDFMFEPDDYALSGEGCAVSATRTYADFRTQNGYLLIGSNGHNFGDFSIRIPISVTYDWGETTPEYVTIQFKGNTTSPTIEFADATTKAICLNYWDTDGNGELTEAEAAAATTIGTVFQQTDITSFNELRYFTGLTSIGEMAFSGCQQLTSVVIPKNVSTVGGGLFHNCDALTSVTVDADNAALDSRGGCNAIINTTTNELLAGCKTTVIPSGVTAIGERAFYHIHGKTSLTIPQTVTSIGFAALFGMMDLTSLTIPKSVVSIGIETIGNNTSLETLVVETGNPVYDSRGGCNAIIHTATNTLVEGCKTTVIPTTVTAIGYCAFDSQPITQLAIPASVTSIDEFAVRLCRSLASITVDANNPVYDSRGDCNAIMETATDKLILGCPMTEFPNGTKAFGNYAFYGYESIEAVNIPATVTAIGSYAFAECDNLTSVTVGMTQPVAIAENTFTNRFNATLYVPSGCKALYQAADYWQDFYDIVEMSTGYTDIASLNDAVYIDPVVTVAGATVALSVKLKNTTLEPVGCTFKLTLPSGAHLLTDSNGDIVYTMGSRAQKMNVTKNKSGYDFYDFALTPSSDNATISGTDGTIITFRMVLPDNMAMGNYQLLLTNCMVQTHQEGTATKENDLSDVASRLQVIDYIMGDVNSDGHVTPADAIMTLYHYFNVVQTGFNEKAADVNSDDRISPADAIEMLYMYFGSSNTARQGSSTPEPQ